MLRSLKGLLGSRPGLRSHFWFTAANHLQQVAAICLGILLARLLTPNDFGLYALIQSALGLALLPTAWSLAPQVLSHSVRSPEVIPRALRFASILVIPKIAACGVVCAIFWKQTGPTAAAVSFVSALPLVFADWVTVLKSSVEARGYFKIHFWDALLTIGISLLVGLPLAFFGFGVWALVLPGIPLFAGQLLLVRRLSGHSFFAPSGTKIEGAWRGGFTLWLASACDQGLHRLDKIFLGSFSTVAEIGNYNRAYNYAPVSARFLNSLVANPTTVSLSRNSDPRVRRHILARCSILLASGGLLNWTIWWFFADPIVPWLFGEQWSEAIPVFQAFSSLGFLGPFAYLPITLLLAEARYELLAIVRVPTLALFCLAAWFLGNDLSAVTMAWLFQAVLLLQGLAFWFLCWRLLRK